jgi:hypothetical protein
LRSSGGSSLAARPVPSSHFSSKVKSVAGTKCRGRFLGAEKLSSVATKRRADPARRACPRGFSRSWPSGGVH